MNNWALKVVKEYGLSWAIDRSLYSLKLKGMSAIPRSELVFEKKVSYPERINLFDINAATLKTILDGLPNNKKQEIIYEADDAMVGKIKGFSSIELDYGNPINWQLNPLTEESCSTTLKWYQIPAFDKKRGDIKVTWEISRFSHFITFARAYLLTDDRKYYEAYSRQLSSWLDDNPYLLGANYMCGQECSLRMANTLLAYTVFENQGIAKPEDEQNIKEFIYRCYKRVLNNFTYAYKCVKNNHTISELMGIMIGSWCCKDEDRLRWAFKLANKVCDEQFEDDGGYCQLSFNYQRLALQDLECIFAIEKKSDFSITSEIKNKIEKSSLLLYQCLDISGDVPNYGSNDGALIFKTTSCGYRNFIPVINTIYFQINGARLFESGIYDEELIWFGGNIDINSIPLKSLKKESSSFPLAGIFTNVQEKYWSEVICNEFHHRPAQMDQLHFDLWSNGKNILCDTGTFSYASEEGDRLKSQNGHNTLEVIGKPQMNTHGRFIIYDFTERKDYLVQGNQFSGTIESKNGYRHRRKIRYLPDEILISDFYMDKDESPGQLLFHTICQPRIVENENAVVLSYDGKDVCKISFDSNFSIEESYRSLYYFQLEKISMISVDISNKQKVHTKINIFD